MHRNQCKCRKSYLANQQVNLNNCSSTCAGNSNQACGGLDLNSNTNFISIYEIFCKFIAVLYLNYNFVF